MRLAHLRSFYGVAITGTFTKAAKFLNISQSTVTSQVRSLEEFYGVELLYRGPRRSVLTPLGEELYALAKQIFALEYDARRLLEDSGKLKTGELRVGAVGPFHVTEMLAKFNKQYPDFSISVQFGNSKEILDSLVEYQTDVAVLAQFMDDPTFFSMPYSSHPVVLIVNSAHRLAGQAEIPIEQLEGEQVILREEGSTTRKAFEDALSQAGVSCRVVMEIGSREAIREAVIMGIGISVVSQAEYIPDPRLHSIEISNASMYTHAHVVCLTERRHSRVVNAFFEIVG